MWGHLIPQGLTQAGQQSFLWFRLNDQSTGYVVGAIVTAVLGLIGVGVTAFSGYFVGKWNSDREFGHWKEKANLEDNSKLNLQREASETQRFYSILDRRMDMAKCAHASIVRLVVTVLSSKIDKRPKSTDRAFDGILRETKLLWSYNVWLPDELVEINEIVTAACKAMGTAGNEDEISEAKQSVHEAAKKAEKAYRNHIDLLSAKVKDGFLRPPDTGQ